MVFSSMSNNSANQTGLYGKLKGFVRHSVKARGFTDGYSTADLQQPVFDECWNCRHIQKSLGAVRHSKRVTSVICGDERPLNCPITILWRPSWYYGCLRAELIKSFPWVERNSIPSKRRSRRIFFNFWFELALRLKQAELMMIVDPSEHFTCHCNRNNV